MTNLYGHNRLIRVRDSSAKVLLCHDVLESTFQVFRIIPYSVGIIVKPVLLKRKTINIIWVYGRNVVIGDESCCGWYRGQARAIQVVLYMANAWGRSSSITPHDEYLNLGHRVDMRCRAYRELFQYRLPDGDIHLIERASEYCHPVGDDRFRNEIEQRYGIKLGQAARGRPLKRVTTG